MIPRRLSENLHSQNWTAVCLDLVIVILGIFLGLQASEWYERRQELVSEESVLQRLQAEFKDILSDAELGIRFHQQEIAALETIYQALTSGERGPVDDARFREGLEGAMNYELGPGRSGTYIEILSSGQFRLLRDRKLRTALIKYDDFVLKADSLFSSFQMNQRKHESVFNRHLTRGPARQQEVEMMPTGVIFLHGDLVDFDIDAMANDDEFLDTIQRLIEYHTNFQFWHGKIHQSASEVLGLLNAARP